MKKILYLGIVLMFASCGANESESESSTANESESESSTVNESESESSTVNFARREASTIKIGNLEVMTEDLGEMNWDEAKKACKNLGDGWRLPTKDELNLLYENKEKIGGFAKNGIGFGKFGIYWSSSELGKSRTALSSSSAWKQTFTSGRKSHGNKNDTYYVRAVRDF